MRLLLRFTWDVRLATLKVIRVRALSKFATLVLGTSKSNSSGSRSTNRSTGIVVLAAVLVVLLSSRRPGPRHSSELHQVTSTCPETLVRYRPMLLLLSG